MNSPYHSYTWCFHVVMILHFSKNQYRKLSHTNNILSESSGIGGIQKLLYPKLDGNELRYQSIKREG